VRSPYLAAAVATCSASSAVDRALWRRCLLSFVGLLRSGDSRYGRFGLVVRGLRAGHPRFRLALRVSRRCGLFTLCGSRMRSFVRVLLVLWLVGGCSSWVRLYVFVCLRGGHSHSESASCVTVSVSRGESRSFYGTPSLVLARVVCSCLGCRFFRSIVCLLAVGCLS